MSLLPSNTLPCPTTKEAVVLLPTELHPGDPPQLLLCKLQQTMGLVDPELRPIATHPSDLPLQPSHIHPGPKDKMASDLSATATTLRTKGIQLLHCILVHSRGRAVADLLPTLRHPNHIHYTSTSLHSPLCQLPRDRVDSVLGANAGPPLVLQQLLHCIHSHPRGMGALGTSTTAMLRYGFTAASLQTSTCHA